MEETSLEPSTFSLPAVVATIKTAVEWSIGFVGFYVVLAVGSLLTNNWRRKSHKSERYETQKQVIEWF